MQHLDDKSFLFNNALVCGKPPPQYLGKSMALGQACLVSEANSLLYICRTILNVKGTLLFSASGAIQYFKNHKCIMMTKINISKSCLPPNELLQQKKLNKQCQLELQNWHSKFFNLSKWLYYDYTSNLAYRPTKNKNIPLISGQKQGYVLLILYHAHSRWHKSKSPSKPCQWSLLADGLHLILLKTPHIMAIETVLSTLNGIIR